jgi:hypothetical protein
LITIKKHMPAGGGSSYGRCLCSSTVATSGNAPFRSLPRIIRHRYRLCVPGRTNAICTCGKGNVQDRLFQFSIVLATGLIIVNLVQSGSSMHIYLSFVWNGWYIE